MRDEGEIWCYYNALRIPSSIEHYKDFGSAREFWAIEQATVVGWNQEKVVVHLALA